MKLNPIRIPISSDKVKPTNLTAGLYFFDVNAYRDKNKWDKVNDGRNTQSNNIFADEDYTCTVATSTFPDKTFVRRTQRCRTKYHQLALIHYRWEKMNKDDKQVEEKSIASIKKAKSSSEDESSSDDEPAPSKKQPAPIKNAKAESSSEDESSSDDEPAPPKKQPEPLKKAKAESSSEGGSSSDEETAHVVKKQPAAKAESSSENESSSDDKPAPAKKQPAPIKKAKSSSGDESSSDDEPAPSKKQPEPKSNAKQAKTTATQTQGRSKTIIEPVDSTKRPLRTLYVSDLSRDVTKSDLENFFKEAGEIVEIRIPKKNRGGKNRGFGFVEFASCEEAEEGLKLISKPLLKRFIEISILQQNERVIATKKWKENCGARGETGGRFSTNHV